MVPKVVFPSLVGGAFTVEAQGADLVVPGVGIAVGVPADGGLPVGNVLGERGMGGTPR